MRRAMWVCLGLALTGCEAVSPPLPQPVRALSDEAWAGNEVLLRSAGFSQGAYITIDGRNVGGRVVDDSTVAIRMPEVAGSVLLTIDGLAIERTEIPVRVYGYAGVVAAPGMGVSLPWPAWPRSSEFISGTNDNNTIRVDARTGRVLDAHPGYACYRGPGPSYRPDVFTVCTRGAQAVTASFAPVDSVGYLPARQAAQLGPGRWLIGDHHNQVSYGNGTWIHESSEENHRLMVSPRGDRALSLFNRNEAGVPVWDAATATIAYHVTLLTELSAATFGNGDTLYLVGSEELNDPSLRHILMVNATTGEVLRDHRLTYDSLYPADAVLSADARYLLVLKVVGDPSPRIDVFDAVTLDSLAVIPSPRAALPPGSLPRMAIDREDLFVTSATYTAPGAIVRFRLPPLRP